MFMSGYKTCRRCGRVQKMYRDFESQWTVVDTGAVMLAYCPVCWGIPDPAPAYCKHYGHDVKQGKCERCGKKVESNG